METKVVCPDFMSDGNIFAIVGKSRRALKKGGYYDEADEMSNRVTKSSSYHEALGIVLQYVTPGKEGDLYCIRCMRSLDEDEYETNTGDPVCEHCYEMYVLSEEEEDG